jgi:hypothetical protein
MIYMLYQIIMEIWDSATTQRLREILSMESGMSLTTVESKNLNMTAREIFSIRFALMRLTTCSIGEEIGMKRIGRRVLTLRRLLSSLTCNYYKNEYFNQIKYFNYIF